MGQAQRRRKNLSKNKQLGKARRTRNKTKDLDQIIEDLEPQNLVKLQHQQPDEDLPGLGQFYCVFCSRYFITQSALDSHYKTKEHKKRLKKTKEEPYTINDSLKYAGLN
jgi:bud site selection protein 20